jgi:SAM-dependent methyltransferase
MTPAPGGEGWPSFERRWRNRFQEYADERDDDAGIAGWSVTGLDARVRGFRGLWDPGAPGRRWLDAGCGAGTYSRILVERGLVVVGVDYSLPSLRKAAERGPGRIALAVADVRRLPFRPAAFDGVLCLGVTQALAESGPAVRELAAQVRPGGELWLDALNRWCVVHAYELLRRWAGGRPIHLRYESPARLERLLREAGFGAVRLHWMPILPTRWYALQRIVESGPLRLALRTVPLLGMFLSHAFILRAEKAPAGAAPAEPRA